MSLVLTLMQPLRAKYEGVMDKNEFRRSRYGAWDFYQSQSQRDDSIITQQVRQLIKQSMGNTVQVPVLDWEDVTITNTRSCTVADHENTSKLLTLTFATYSFGFTMIPAQYFNNDLGYQLDFTKKLEKYLIKLAATLDTAAVNNLSTKKNSYFPAEISAFYPVVANALQVTQAQASDYYNQAETILNVMDFYSANTNVIGSTTGRPQISRLMAQGAGNQTNQAFQFSGYNWEYTNRVTNGAGVQSTHYLVADGYVGVENRNDPDAIARSRTGLGQVWGEAMMPLVNLNMATYYYDNCADKSALHAGTTNLTRTRVEGFEWSTDLCFVNAYNSDPTTRYYPIIKTEISAT
jgi:hypothetical protein